MADDLLEEIKGSNGAKILDLFANLSETWGATVKKLSLALSEIRILRKRVTELESKVYQLEKESL